jgi:hypothetical protein
VKSALLATVTFLALVTSAAFAIADTANSSQSPFNIPKKNPIEVVLTHVDNNMDVCYLYDINGTIRIAVNNVNKKVTYYSSNQKHIGTIPNLTAERFDRFVEIMGGMPGRATVEKKQLNWKSIFMRLEYESLEALEIRPNFDPRASLDSVPSA